nr:hypothetical protein CFP56_02718 [Quercus suber]
MLATSSGSDVIGHVSLPPAGCQTLFAWNVDTTMTRHSRERDGMHKRSGAPDTTILCTVLYYSSRRHTVLFRLLLPLLQQQA